MATDPTGAALSILTRISGSPIVDKLKLRKPLDAIVYRGSRTGFAVMKEANKRFKPMKTLAKPVRPGKSVGGAVPEKFDLTLTDDQAMFQDAVSRLASEVIAPAAESADEACVTPDSILQQIHELGIGMLAIPEELGGAGGEYSPMTHALVAEELSRGDMGIALAALAPLAVINALSQWGTAGQQAKYLTAFAGEDFVPAALAINEGRPLFDPQSLMATAATPPHGYVLSGIKTMVPLASTAEVFLVAAEIAGKGPQLFLIERDAEGLTVEPEPAMGIRAANTGRLILDHVEVGRDALLGEAETGFDYQQFLSLARIAQAALAVGTGQAVLDYVIDYVKERKAFGEPVANRQAVAFMVADIGIELEGLRLLTWRGASRSEYDMPFEREAFLAYTFAAEKGMEIGTNGVQLLGGHGFTKEHPVERWYRNLRSVAVNCGGLIV